MMFVTQRWFRPVLTPFLKFFALLNRSEMASGVGKADSKELNPRKNLEEEYLDYEEKVQT